MIKFYPFCSIPNFHKPNKTSKTNKSTPNKIAKKTQHLLQVDEGGED